MPHKCMKDIYNKNVENTNKIKEEITKLVEMLGCIIFVLSQYVAYIFVAFYHKNNNVFILFNLKEKC